MEPIISRLTITLIIILCNVLGEVTHAQNTDTSALHDADATLQDPAQILALSPSASQVPTQAVSPPPVVSTISTLAIAGYESRPNASGSGSIDAKFQAPLTPDPVSTIPQSDLLPSSTPASEYKPSINETTPDTPSPTSQRSPGPAGNPFPPGTNNCLTKPYCSIGEECFVLPDGLVCLPAAQNWGFILFRNSSGIPAIPGWSGPFSQLNESCTQFQMPDSRDKPGLALLVYDLIRDTLPKDLLISQFDQTITNWYTYFSNCDPSLACSLGVCQPRPKESESCTSSWQCNALALGLDEQHNPIPAANRTDMRCEYQDGQIKSVNTTCQLLYRNRGTGARLLEDDSQNGGGLASGFSIWFVIAPVVAILIAIYFGTVAYQRRMREQKRRKWSQTGEDDRSDFHMEAYDEIY
ncbi:hypothetical protein FBU30_005208 [Linnemannia zychae]|nr:hypothetical protein FBU30_005208 [Linnemannia zychae]